VVGEPFVVTRSRTAVAVAGGVVVVAWLALEARTHTFTRGAEVITGVAIVVFSLVAAPRVLHERVRPFDIKGVTIWGVAALVVVGVELFNLFAGPRSQFPTISSMTNTLVSQTPLGRVILALAWLVLGAWLVLCGS
jgi:hypothetical protein